MRIAIFGGTFDPPHLAHLHVAQAVQSQFEIDEVIWIPAFQNPMKQQRTAPPRKRLKMVELCLRDQTGMSLSDLEITRGGPSFTIDTLNELVAMMPGEYWVIMGSDSLAQFREWKQPEKILRLARLAVITRPAVDRTVALRNFPEEWLSHVDFVEMPPSEISSTGIRYEASIGNPIDEFVTPAVAQYIRENNLYA